jgi:hypothetical protein
MSLFKISSFYTLLILLSLSGCQTAPEREGSQNSSSASSKNSSPSSVQRENKGTIEVYLSQRVAAVPLGRLREMSITDFTPEIQVDGMKNFPFIEFQLDESPRSGESLVIESKAASLNLESVGLSQPRVYTMIQGVLTPVKLLRAQHTSELGACLTAKWFYDLSRVPQGARILVTNEAQGFSQSMGKVDVKNPNLNLKKSVGICTMVSIFPMVNASYKIYLGSR